MCDSHIFVIYFICIYLYLFLQTESGNYGDKEEMLYNRLNYAHNILR